MLIPAITFAAGNSGHHGSVTDLIAPVVNVAILMGVIIWKAKTPISEGFKESSKTIADTIDRAASKAKEAKMMMDTQKQKLANLDKEISEIKKRAENEVETFKQEERKDFENRSQKLKEHSVQKVEAEKKQAIEKLNNSLLDAVILNTKKKLKSDKSLSQKASDQILKGLR